MKTEWKSPLDGEPLPFDWGTVVRDTVSGRSGHLMAIRKDDGERLAYLRPVGGGQEWTTPADRIVRADGAH